MKDEQNGVPLLLHSAILTLQSLFLGPHIPSETDVCIAITNPEFVERVTSC